MQRDFLTRLLRCAASGCSHTPRELGAFLSDLEENVSFETRLKLLFLFSPILFLALNLRETSQISLTLILFSVMRSSFDWKHLHCLRFFEKDICFETCIPFVPCSQDGQSDILYKFWTAVTQTLSSQFQSATDCKYSI